MWTYNQNKWQLKIMLKAVWQRSFLAFKYGHNIGSFSNLICDKKSEVYMFYVYIFENCIIRLL